MSELSNKSTQETAPEDIIAGYVAAAILGVSTRTVRRWGLAKQFGMWEYPDRSGYFYSRAEIEAKRATLRRVS